MTLRQAFTPILVLLVGAAVFAPVGGATKPTRTPVPSGPLDLPAGTACPFEVTGVVDRNNQVGTTFSDGTTRFTGSFKATLSANGKSVSLNVPGSVSLVANGDGSFTFKGTGQNIYAFFPGDLGAGEPGHLWLLDGNTTYQLDPNFFPVPGTFVHNGKTTDLCAALS